MCPGCGLPVGPGAGVGRRARYHGPACRQRARRARLATAPDRSALLDQVGRAEHALAVLRRDLLAGASLDVEVVAGELAALAARLRTRAVPPAPVDMPQSASGPAPTAVTEPVTPNASGPAAPVAKSRRRPAAPVDSEPIPPIPPAWTAGVVGGVDIAAVDLDTVRVERAGGYEISGAWAVLAGPADDPVRLGTLHRTGGRGSRWQARTDTGIPAGGGPWSSRQDALVGLVGHYQAVAENAAGRRGRHRS